MHEATIVYCYDIFCKWKTVLAMNSIIHKIENTSWTWNFVVVSTKYMSDTIHSSSLIIFCAKKFHITHCYFKQYFFVKKQKEKIQCLCSFLHVGGTWFSSFCFLCLVYHICILYVWLVFTCIDQTINMEIKIHVQHLKECNLIKEDNQCF